MSSKLGQIFCVYDNEFVCPLESISPKEKLKLMRERRFQEKSSSRGSIPYLLDSPKSKNSSKHLLRSLLKRGNKDNLTMSMSSKVRLADISMSSMATSPQKPQLSTTLKTCSNSVSNFNLKIYERGGRQSQATLADKLKSKLRMIGDMRSSLCSNPIKSTAMDEFNIEICTTISRALKNLKIAETRFKGCKSKSLFPLYTPSTM